MNTNETSLPDVMTVPQLAQMLQIGRNTAYALVKSGQIRCIRIGRSIRVTKTDVLNYLHQSNHP